MRALVWLGLLAEASKVLLGLMRGEGLPDAVLDSPLVLKNEDGTVLSIPPVAPLDARLLPGDPANKPAIGVISDGPVPAPVEKLYGPWMVAHLALARASFLQHLGSVPNLWQATSPATGAKLPPGAPQQAEAIEPQLLVSALALVGRAKAMAEGTPLEAETGPKDRPPTASKGGKPGAAAAAKPASGTKKKEDPKKGGQDGVAGGAPPALDGPALKAQKAEVLVRALLAGSECELSRWRPAAALEPALAALRFMGGLQEAGSLNLPLGDNDDTERFSLGPALWASARLQVVRCTAALRHAGPCAELVAAGLADAATANDGLAAAQLLAVQAAVQELAGQAADALNTYSEVISRYAGLSLHDVRLGRVLAAAAALRDRLGLRDDAERLAHMAAELLGECAAELGLGEAKVRGGCMSLGGRVWRALLNTGKVLQRSMGIRACKPEPGLGKANARVLRLYEHQCNHPPGPLQDHPELVNIYATGYVDFVGAQAHVAQCAARRLDLASAVELLSHALLLLRCHTRALPTQASFCTWRGGALRMQTGMLARAWHSMSMHNPACYANHPIKKPSQLCTLCSTPPSRWAWAVHCAMQSCCCHQGSPCPLPCMLRQRHS